MGKSVGVQVGEDLAEPKKAGQVFQMGEPREEGRGERAAERPPWPVWSFSFPS